MYQITINVESLKEAKIIDKVIHIINEKATTKTKKVNEKSDFSFKYLHSMSEFEKGIKEAKETEKFPFEEYDSMRKKARKIIENERKKV